jgi:hypothetical protein
MPVQRETEGYPRIITSQLPAGSISMAAIAICQRGSSYRHEALIEHCGLK